MWLFPMHIRCVYLFCPWCRTQSESWNLSWKILNLTWAVIWGSTRTFSMSKWHLMLKFIPTGTSLNTCYFINHFTVHLIMNSQDQQSSYLYLIIYYWSLSIPDSVRLASRVYQIRIYFLWVPQQCKLIDCQLNQPTKLPGRCSLVDNIIAEAFKEHNHVLSDISN